MKALKSWHMKVILFRKEKESEFIISNGNSLTFLKFYLKRIYILYYFAGTTANNLKCVKMKFTECCDNRRTIKINLNRHFFQPMLIVTFVYVPKSEQLPNRIIRNLNAQPYNSMIRQI